MINRVLLLDFPNEAAWRLLQRLAGSSQPLQDFQVEFTSKYYPDKLHLLAVQGPDWLDAMEEEPQTPANPAPGPAPVVHSAMPPAPSARQQCLRRNPPGMRPPTCRPKLHLLRGVNSQNRSYGPAVCWRLLFYFLPCCYISSCVAWEFPV